MQRISIANQRSKGRKPEELRPISFTREYLSSALGSCLVEFGNTRVLCAASIEDNVASWLKGKNRGWVTAEYSMLPASTPTRTKRETMGLKGRTQEIQRLIGRSLRAVVDTGALGEITMTVDCDVLQADGGTRTAAITGAWIAMNDAFVAWHKAGKIKTNPVFDQLAAVSVGMVDGVCLLDLDYLEDSRAEVDMNLVMTGAGRFIEVQGTGERTSFDREQLNALLDLGTQGIEALFELQKQVLAH
ncbi:MAG: ribonuclease PH [Coriobacteriia bacterium]|nr:ribonuclease PH [Coriobacteriia bacterium]MCL2750170.1 ribonuclease PH [Coriobacteriia bacterium]